MDCMEYVEEDSLILSILGKICAETKEFQWGKGNCGWAGAVSCIPGDGCDYSDDDIYFDFLYLSKLDRE